MTQSFTVQEIIISRQKHIAHLKKILTKTISHDAEMSIIKEIHDDEQSLEIFENSETFKMIPPEDDIKPYMEIFPISRNNDDLFDRFEEKE